MTANHTEIMIDKLSAGELQRLAVELLPRLHNDWGTITQSGTVEGTFSTRKGTPDAWCERKDETYVYIQATGDKKKGKVLDDLSKSISELVKNNASAGALCVAFISFDAQPEEIIKCKDLTIKHGAQFVYYDNSSIAKLLDNDENHDLRYKYLNIATPTKAKIKPELEFTLVKSQGSEPKSLKNINKVLNWNNNEEELKGTLSSVMQFYEQLKNINVPSRRFLASILELAEPTDGFFSHMIVPIQEVKNGLSLDNHEISAQMSILEKYKLGYIDGGEWPVQIIITASDWPLLENIKDYCKKEGIDLKEIIVHLQFSLLD